MKLKSLLFTFLLLSLSFVACAAQWTGCCTATETAQEKIAVLEVTPVTFNTATATQLGLSSIKDNNNIAPVVAGQVQLAPGSYIVQGYIQSGANNSRTEPKLLVRQGTGVIQQDVGGHWIGSFGANEASHAYSIYLEVTATSTYNLALVEPKDPETITIINDSDTKSHIIIKKIE